MNSTFIYNVLPRLIDFISHSGLVQIRRINQSWMYLFRTIAVGRVAEKYQTRTNKLTAFKAYLMHLPVQGSAEWLAQRAGSATGGLQELLLKIHNLKPGYRFPPTIGGSELPGLLGHDGGKSKQVELIRNKLGIIKFDGNLYTNWGKMFELVINLWTETVFDCSLVETGSVPGLRNQFGAAIQSYSPDGVGTVRMQRLREVIERENIKFTESDEYKSLTHDPDQTERIVLFEFKCPIMRKPDGTVPKKYQAQPQLGMSSLGIPEIGIFGDAAFRKCKLNDFNFTYLYDFSIPPTAEDKRIKEIPQCLGFIGVYEENARSKNGKKRSTPEVFREIAKTIYEMTINNHEFTKQDYYRTALIAINSYESLMSNEFDQLEFSKEERQQILCIAIRNAIPELNKMDRTDCYKMLYGVIATMDWAKEPDSIQDLSFGIDLGYTRFDQSENAHSMNNYELLPIETVHDSINRNKSLTGEEFASLITHAQNNTSIKLYYPNRFCYQTTNPYASDLVKMDGNNRMDVNRQKQCKKWLWRNVREFQQFCFDNNHHPIGVIPYKLMSIRYVPVYKDPDFLNVYKPAVEEFQSQLETFRVGTIDCIEMDKRVCTAYNVLPFLTKPVEPVSFDDVPLETPVAAVVTIVDTAVSFDDLAQIG